MAAGRTPMSAAPKKDPAAVEAEVREKIHLEILKRTGAYHANDHVLLPSGQHTSEYIEKTLVTTEPSFTEGLGAVIATHFAQWPVVSLVGTQFPTCRPEEGPLCRKGIPLTEEFVRRRTHRRASAVQEPRAF